MKCYKLWIECVSIKKDFITIQEKETEKKHLQCVIIIIIIILTAAFEFIQQDPIKLLVPVKQI